MFYSSSEVEFLCFTNQVSPKASSGCHCVSDTKPSLCSTCVLSMLYILTLFKCACGSSVTFSMQEVSESLQFLLLPLKQLTLSSFTSMSRWQHVGVEAHWLRCMHLQVISGIPLWGWYCPTPPPTSFLCTRSLCSYMLECLRTAFSGFVNWSSLSSRCVLSAVLELYGVIYSRIVYVNLDFFFFFFFHCCLKWLSSAKCCIVSFTSFYLHTSYLDVTNVETAVWTWSTSVGVTGWVSRENSFLYELLSGPFWFFQNM